MFADFHAVFENIFHEDRGLTNEPTDPPLADA
jgi:hypothetical protein